MSSNTNSQQNAGQARPRTPYGGPPFNERYDSSPETTPPTTQIPNTSPASSGHGAAVIRDETPGLIPDTPPVDRMSGRRGAIQADVLLPAQPAFQDVASHHPRSIWPEQTPDVPGGRPDVSRRCPHDLVHPCFCRNITDKVGFVCRACRFPICSVNQLLLTGPSGLIQDALDREIVRERQSDQLQFEMRSALEAALAREQRSRGGQEAADRNGNNEQ